MSNAQIDKTAIIGNNSIIKDGCIIGKNVEIGDNCIIKENTSIGDNSYISDFSIIGEVNVGFYNDRKNYTNPKTSIGKNSLIRSHSIIYAGCNIGDNFQTGHRVTIRENTKIGNNTRIGTLCDIQGSCEIGNYVSFHSNVHICTTAIIKDYVWIFPYTILTNDPNPPSLNEAGPIVEEYAIICTRATILPGLKIGKNSLIGACALVSKDVDEGTIVVGNPDKNIGATSRIKDKTTGEEYYPWMKNFSRNMPWQDLGYEQWLKENS